MVTVTCRVSDSGVVIVILAFVVPGSVAAICVNQFVTFERVEAAPVGPQSVPEVGECE